MDFAAIRNAAEAYKPAMVKFLRDMIAIPSESCEEEGVVKRIAEELKALGYDKVEFDKLGNVIGWMGEGDKIIAIDSHIDTVGIGNIENWEADPYKGYETDDIIYGRGGSDQEGGMAAAAYGVKIMKDLDLLPKGYKMMVVGSVASTPPWKKRTKPRRQRQRRVSTLWRSACWHWNAQHQGLGVHRGDDEAHQDGKALYLHCLPADITGLSCAEGEVDNSVFDRYIVPLYKQASYKPYIIAAAVFMAQVRSRQGSDGAGRDETPASSKALPTRNSGGRAAAVVFLGYILLVFSI